MVVSHAGGDGGVLECNTSLQIWRCSLKFLKLFRVSMGLVGSRSSETDPVVTCQFRREFERREHAPWRSAGAQT